MAKLWQGLANGTVSAVADKFNNSIPFDKRLYKEDIEGSIAHAKMLSKCSIIEKNEADAVIGGLLSILNDIESGALEIDLTCEDIHTFIEQTLTERIGEAGKKLHTARSRNDQVALDLRLYCLKEIETLKAGLKALITSVCDKAEEYKDYIVSGYTHLQRAQPITFGHQLMAYAQMFLRDVDRLSDCAERTAISPIGSCALAGTTYPTDRFYEAELLGLKGVCENSIDGVSDRDFVCELIFCLSMISAHLSRFSEEIILWSSWEFGYIRLSDEFTTGSSIMPQKKNSDMAELARGKTGRVFGDLTAILTVIKGLPLAYNKDMQEEKEALFDALDTVKICLEVFAPMVASMTANKENMLNAAKKGFINATDLADYLTKKGVPFRTAYKTVGEIVAKCVKENNVLEDLTLEEYKAFNELFDNDLYTEIDLVTCVNKRTSYGGTSVESVKVQIENVREVISYKL